MTHVNQRTLLGRIPQVTAAGEISHLSAASVEVAEKAGKKAKPVPADKHAGIVLNLAKEGGNGDSKDSEFERF